MPSGDPDISFSLIKCESETSDDDDIYEIIDDDELNQVNEAKHQHHNIAIKNDIEMLQVSIL